MKEDFLRDKTFDFAQKTIKICRQLSDGYKDSVLARQLLRSGTAVGALVREARFAQSRADFVNKLSIGLKECNESQYWLTLIAHEQLIEKSKSDELINLSNEIISLLVASIKKAKGIR